MQLFSLVMKLVHNFSLANFSEGANFSQNFVCPRRLTSFFYKDFFSKAENFTSFSEVGQIHLFSEGHNQFHHRVIACKENNNRTFQNCFLSLNLSVPPFSGCIHITKLLPISVSSVCLSPCFNKQWVDLKLQNVLTFANYFHLKCEA